ncbi:MAG: hypothetical protein ACQES1_06780 [Bacteroidota bacterium]
MKKFLPRFFSVVFHPLLSLFYAALLIFHSGHYSRFIDTELVFAVLLIFLILTAVLPAILMPFLYYQRTIPDLRLRERKSRLSVYVLMLILYVINSFLLYRFAFPDLFRDVMLSGTIILGIVSVVSLFYHVSAHTVAIGGLTGLCMFMNIQFNVDLRLEFIILFLLSGIIGSSRLALAYHKPHEIYTGFILGGGCMGGCMYLLV